jgi:glycosyltransferase involved in cell wall biosynthesis
MRNEAEHIDDVVADIADQDFEGEVELIVADGASTDGSVQKLREACARHGVAVAVIPNPDVHVSQGLNRCIGEARGDLLVRVDCHSRYPADYLRMCARASEETGAENVGGVLLPRGRTPTERAVACAMNGPFGGIGWTRHSGSARLEVDTVPFSAVRPETYERVGGFDETLVRNQDDEFNLRLRRAGGKVVLDPAIRAEYTPRGSLRGVFRQYFEYGFWKPRVMRKHRRATSLRSLAPAAFVATIVVLALLAPWVSQARWFLVLALGSYALAAVGFGTASLRRCNADWSLLPNVVAVFPAFHVGHGLGFVVGTAALALPGPLRARLP